MEDSYEIPLPGDIPPGEYRVGVGMYDVTTMRRIAAFDANGARLAHDRAILGVVQVD
jgi:hypothetical protein